MVTATQRTGSALGGLLVLLAVLSGCNSRVVDSGAETQSPPDHDAFLDDLQERTFHWFWDETNPGNGLTQDRAPRRTFASIAAVGFALTAYPIGVERGYITRAQAVERTLSTLRFFWRAPQGPEPAGITGYRGFFYHFLHVDTGERFQTTELSTIDTSLLLGGVITAQEYFDGDTPDEAAIRAYADSIYHRVEWTFIQPRAPRVAMAWRPEQGFGRADWSGYNEAMILYVLALGSPTYPVGPESWDTWTSTYQWGTFHGSEPHVGFGPLFGHQYSHVWIDFRGIQDEYMRGRGIDYFENSRRATLGQQRYAIANPDGWYGYGADNWGFTASDGPTNGKLVIDGRERQFHTYWARGASFTGITDDGTIVPTAAGGSVPFAPEITIPTLYAMFRRYGQNLYGEYGFLDAFNPTLREQVTTQHGTIVPGVGWFDGDYLGIDQGPILIMIENYRTGLIWDLVRQSPYIVRGLCRAGFSGGWLEGKCGG